jgi:hypothetical protein
METVGGSFQLMLFIYALAAVISLAAAWIIKCVFYVIKLQSGGAASQKPATTRGDAPAIRTT